MIIRIHIYSSEFLDRRFTFLQLHEDPNAAPAGTPTLKDRTIGISIVVTSAVKLLTISPLMCLP